MDARQSDWELEGWNSTRAADLWGRAATAGLGATSGGAAVRDVDAEGLLTSVDGGGSPG